MKKLIIIFLLLSLYGCSTFGGHTKEYTALKMRIDTLENQIQTNSVNIKNNSFRIGSVEKKLLQIEERLQKERQQDNFSDKIPPISAILGGNDNKSVVKAVDNKTKIEEKEVIAIKAQNVKTEEKKIDSVKDTPKDNNTVIPTNVNYVEYYNKALSAYRKKNFELASSMFKNFLNSYKDNDLDDNALFWLAHCYLHMGQTNRAIETFKILLKKYPFGAVISGGKTDAALYDLVNLYSYDKKKAEYYKNILLKRFPASRYAKIVKKTKGG